MIILSLGSNLSSKFGDRIENLKVALSMIEENEIIIKSKSSYYESPSFPDTTKPKFINIIILVESKLEPEILMSKLIYIEEKMGRKRDKKNDPRICDIDIIDYKNKVIHANLPYFDLTIPHKELIFRNFVLIPLKEIVPDWIHPKTKETIDALIQKLSNDDINSILKISEN